MTITPPDALVAARSFPRRWRALFATAAGDEDMSDLLDRSGAKELAARAAGVLEDTAAKVHGGLTARPGDDVLDRVEAAADHLAGAIEAVPPDSWQGGPIEALSSGIDEAAALLRRAEKAIEEARARR